jgi:predicted acyltransferase (DUF342 family)
MLIIVFILFILLFALPFVPGILEMFIKKDADPLFIAMDYIKDPRYFGKSFKNILQTAATGLETGPELHDVTLSKKEKLQMSESINIPSEKKVDHLLYVQGNLASANGARFVQEVYVTKDAAIGPNNTVHVLAVDGNLTVASGTKFERWIDADGDIDIGANCNLGINASSGAKLFLTKNCVFRRLYGMPIATGNEKSPAYDYKTMPQAQVLPPEMTFVRSEEQKLPPASIISTNMVFKQDIQIGYDSLIKGDIKCYGKLVLEENVSIDGNLFADGDIIIGRGANIRGNVFSQTTVLISAHSVISCPGLVKSIIGKKSVQIEPNVAIYGYVSTEGSGIIL